MQTRTSKQQVANLWVSMPHNADTCGRGFDFNLLSSEIYPQNKKVTR